MATRMQALSLVVIGAVGAVGVAEAPAQTEDPVAFVTVLTGGGALRIDAGRSIPIDNAAFSAEGNGVTVGQGVATAADGTAVVVLPRSGVVAYLQTASRLLIPPTPLQTGGDAVALKLAEGHASVTRKPSEAAALVVAGEADGAAGYVVLTDGSILVTAGRGTVTFAVQRGAATFFPGRLPDRAILDESGRPADDSGVALSEGYGISTQDPTTPVPYDAGAVAAVSKQMRQDTYAFGVSQSTRWVKRAERGDFTPVRAGEGRAPAELVGTEFVPPQAFDQPQQLVTTVPVRGAVASAVRTIVNPAERLTQSEIPGSVIAGQRFRRSLIIGSPGTTGQGPIVVNPNAELLIRLAGR